MHGIYIHAHCKIKSKRLIQGNMTYRHREHYDSDELEKYMGELNTMNRSSSHERESKELAEYMRKLNTTDHSSSHERDSKEPEKYESDSEDLEEDMRALNTSEKALSQDKQHAQSKAHRRKLREADQFLNNCVDAVNKASEAELAITKLARQMIKTHGSVERMRKSVEYEAVMRATREDSASMNWFTTRAKQYHAAYKNALLEAELLKPAHENLL